MQDAGWFAVEVELSDVVLLGQEKQAVFLI